MSRTVNFEKGLHFPVALHPQTLRPGMPHLNNDGVNLGWLLREACHIHTTSVADLACGRPTAVLDCGSARVLASVVACTITGNASQFGKDDACTLHLSERPTANNGWRSQVDLINTQYHAVYVEVFSVFARRQGPSNRDLSVTDVGKMYPEGGSGDGARRTNLIRRLAAADIAHAQRDRCAPQQVIPIRRASHFDRHGLVCFAAVHDIIAETETDTLPRLAAGWSMRNRHVHFFGNLDADDSLEITCRTSTQAISAHARVTAFSHIKRTSDEKVIATAQSTYSAA